MKKPHFSIFKILTEAATGNTGWAPQWRKPEPKAEYDAIIVGGGGHGLATAYYLAKNHGMHNIAVIERGIVGQGNVGRNTTIIRSNYLLPGNIPFYETSLKLWENLEQDINYNAMISQRGVHAKLLSRDEIKALHPFLDFDTARFPILGGLLQPRGGTVRHDAVAWGYARAADTLGVDILEHTELTGLRIEGGQVIGAETSRGFIRAKKIGLSVAGNSSRVAAMAGMRLPIESHVLTAFVTEGIKPLINSVITFGAGHFYISQSDKGGLVFGSSVDGYNSYAQRGNLPMIEETCQEAMALMPSIGRLRMLRSWGGIMDMTMDGSPIIDRTPIDGLYLNAGWCIGGFKATPASGLCFAHLIARDEPHKVATAYRLDRFATGALLDESGGGADLVMH
jgi:sarcosine oxidase subunit beta